MILKYNSKLAYSPAFISVLSAYVDLLKSGQGNPRLEFGNQDQVIYVLNDEQTKILGASVFNVVNGLEGAFYFAYTDPEFRRQGIFTMMYAEVQRLLLEQGARVITSGTWNNNEPMKVAFLSENFELTSTRWVKLLNKQIF